MDVVMMLFVPTKVLCNVWSYDIYDNVIYCWAPSSYDKVNFRISSATSGLWGVGGSSPPHPSATNLLSALRMNVKALQYIPDTLSYLDLWLIA